jgi:uncharacterized protein YuzE
MEQKMKIEYDKKTDVLYLHFRKVKPSDSRDVDEGMTLDLDPKGRIVGIEILDAAERIGADALSLMTRKSRSAARRLAS